MKLGDWEAPLLQNMLDQEALLDIAHKSEVIDINKSHHRKQIFESVKRLADKERLSPKGKDVKYDVRRTTLRQMYQIQSKSQMTIKE